MTTIDITSYGAHPENSDNTDLIQHALDIALYGDTVYVPPGEFLVNAIKGVLPRTGTILKLDGNLRAIPNDQIISVVVNLNAVADVTVQGPGSIIGERVGHLVKTVNRGGFCLAAIGCTNLSLRNVILRDAFADGIYVQDCKKVTIDGVSCVNNSRNGMSIISVETMVVANSLFTLTNSESPMPQAGIDIEPDLPSQSLLDISITANRFVRNKGAGVYRAFAPGTNRARIFVVNNTFDQHYKDGSGPCIGGMNTPLSNFLYATCRWISSYDYWAYPTEFTLN